MSPADPEFPFQQVVMEFTDILGKRYMVYADQYMGWVEMALMSSGEVINVYNPMRTWFCTYGAPEEISSHGGPPFESQEYNTFLKNWGVQKHTSSAYKPQSNGCAELAIKTAKEILFDNTDNCGCLCQVRAAWALLTHHNTSVLDLDMSPAVMLYG